MTLFKKSPGSLAAVLSPLVIGLLVLPVQANPGNGKGQPSAKAAAIFAHWTKEKRQAAQPRDLVIDSRGLGYLKKRDGKLAPYGHSVAALASEQAPRARPPNLNCDNNPPLISAESPTDGTTIGTTNQTFSATVEDADCGVRSVSFDITPPGGTAQSFAATNTGGDTYSANFNFNIVSDPSNGWTWQVIARDNARKGGNTRIGDEYGFNVSDGGSGNSGEDTGGDTGDGTVTNAGWESTTAPIQWAAGRIYFEMPNNARRKRWNGYVCSGTVVKDGTSGRSIILTAAHCVYDDANKAFARNVMFIPNQDGTSGSRTDDNCNNDPIGCWYAAFGVVDDKWTQSVFPNNIPWDYAYYVVDDSGSHDGAGSGGALDAAVVNAVNQTGFDGMGIEFGEPWYDTSDDKDFTHALGYSYSEDPHFMYCAEEMTTVESANWWLPSCELSGGSSGGPWTQSGDPDLGDGPIISVNSWGYTTSPGMAGPLLNGNSAACMFGVAKNGSIAPNARPGDEGIEVICSP